MIKLRLEKFESAIVMQVLEIDIVSTGELQELFSNGDMKIILCLSSFLYSNRVQLKTHKSDEIIIRSFENNKDRDEYYARLEKLFFDYSRWKTEEKNIYVL